MSSIDIAHFNIDPNVLKLPHLAPDKIIGQSFLKATEDGLLNRATLVKRIKDNLGENHKQIKQYLVQAEVDKFEELMTYNDLITIIVSQHENSNEYDDE
jgi:hypothetical protein